MSAPEKKKSFMGEFKTFIARGNVMDMAVGVIIGGAFGKISTSLVNDVIMPLISVLTGGVDFSNWKIVLKAAVAGVDGEIDPATEGWRVVGACCVSLVFTCGENSFASLPLLFPRNPFHWACAGALKLRQRYRQPSGTVSSGSPSAFCCGRDGAAFSGPWPRSGGYARGSR